MIRCPEPVTRGLRTLTPTWRFLTQPCTRTVLCAAELARHHPGASCRGSQGSTGPTMSEGRAGVESEGAAGDRPPHGGPKRRFPRYRIDLPLTVCDQHDHELEGRCLVIGEGGLGAVLPRPVPVGSVVQLRFALPTHATQLHLWAVVRNQLDLRHGLEFVSVTEEERLSIRRFCGDLPTQSGSG